MKKIICFLLAFTMLFALCSCGKQAELDNYKKQMQAKLDEYENQIEQLNSSMSELTSKTLSQEKEIEQLEKEVEENKSKLDQFKEKIGNPIGGFISYEEAYEKGLITRDDMMHIAYYRFGEVRVKDGDGEKEIPFTPTKPLTPLTEKEIEDIRLTVFFKKYDDCIYTETPYYELRIESFYGCYNGYYAVEVYGNWGYGPAEREVYIGGISFSIGPSAVELFYYC